MARKLGSKARLESSSRKLDSKARLDATLLDSSGLYAYDYYNGKDKQLWFWGEKRHSIFGTLHSKIENRILDIDVCGNNTYCGNKQAWFIRPFEKKSNKELSSYRQMTQRFFVTDNEIISGYDTNNYTRVNYTCYSDKFNYRLDFDGKKPYTNAYKKTGNIYQKWSLIPVKIGKQYGKSENWMLFYMALFISKC